MMTFELSMYEYIVSLHDDVLPYNFLTWEHRRLQ